MWDVIYLKCNMWDVVDLKCNMWDVICSLWGYGERAWESPHTHNGRVPTPHNSPFLTKEMSLHCTDKYFGFTLSLLHLHCTFTVLYCTSLYMY